jgi:hypothetical protein
MNTARDTLFVAARATEGSAPDQFSVEIPSRPTVGSPAERAAFRAIRTAGDDLTASPRGFGGVYNSYVLPQADGKWLVYFLPGQRQTGVHLHGADYRYLVSAEADQARDRGDGALHLRDQDRWLDHVEQVGEGRGAVGAGCPHTRRQWHPSSRQIPSSRATRGTSRPSARETVARLRRHPWRSVPSLSLGTGASRRMAGSYASGNLEAPRFSRDEGRTQDPG